jgi:hypothetical protein
MTTTVELLSYEEEVARALGWELHEIAGQPLVEVRVTPVWSSRSGLWAQVWTVLALDSQGREVPLPGAVTRVVDLLRSAFPLACWSRAQDYDVRTGALTEHVTHTPDSLTATPERSAP